jgi:hypothetical protein
MSSPPDPPPNQPNQPGQPPPPSRNNKRTGAFVAIAAIVLISLIVGLLSGNNTLLGTGLLAMPVVSLACVILGSILTTSKRTRQFAVGFLIPGAIILVVTAGACVALLMAFSSGL